MEITIYVIFESYNDDDNDNDTCCFTKGDSRGKRSWM